MPQSTNLTRGLTRLLLPHRPNQKIQNKLVFGSFRMNAESDYTLYRGNCLPNGATAFVIVTGQCDGNGCVTEYFIIETGSEKIQASRTLLGECASHRRSSGISSRIPEGLFTLTQIFQAELKNAEAWIEKRILEQLDGNRSALCRFIPYKLTPLGDEVFISLRFRRELQSELKFVEEHTYSQPLKKFFQKIKSISEIHRAVEDPNDN
jgi:hypothetical protein